MARGTVKRIFAAYVSVVLAICAYSIGSAVYQSEQQAAQTRAEATRSLGNMRNRQVSRTVKNRLRTVGIEMEIVREAERGYGGGNLSVEELNAYIADFQWAKTVAPADYAILQQDYDRAISWCGRRLQNLAATPSAVIPSLDSR